jgi:hypothetical protein
MGIYVETIMRGKARVLPSIASKGYVFTKIKSPIPMIHHVS